MASSSISTMQAAVKEKPPSQCNYCDMTFKKLEHAQRHERTHTLDRPYSCTHCGKTFARQDTLNRHARLHTRTKEDGQPAKGRKRRSSVASQSSPKTKMNTALGAAPPLDPNNIIAPLSPVSPSSVLPFSLSLPVTIPSFPAYSRSAAPSSLAHDFSAMNGQHANPQHLRRGSDASYAHLLGGLTLDLGSGTHAAFPPTATTFTQGFELMGSPQSDTSSSSDTSEGSSYTTSVEMEASSQYPSPAFTSYSPSTLHDTMADLEAILANDPLHASMAASSRKHAAAAAQPRMASSPGGGHGGFGNNEDFDFDNFAASVEGPPTTSALSFEDLLNASRSGLDAFPQSMTTSATALHQQPQHHLDFDFGDFSAAERHAPISASAPTTSFASSISVPSLAMPMQPKSRPSFTMPSLVMNSSADPKSPSLGLTNMAFSSPPTGPTDFSRPELLTNTYASSFPSLSLMPNGLGLHHDVSPTLLMEAYARRTGSNATPTPATAAFYIPSSSSAVDHTRLSSSVPSPYLRA